MIDKKVNEISNVLIQNQSQKPGLFDGKTGEAIFFAYKYLYTKSLQDLQDCHQIIETVFEDFEQENLIYTHCIGFSGMAWGINHLIELGILDMDSKEYLEDINKYALQFAKNDLLYNKNWDFLHGALGVIFYILDLSYYEDYKNELEELLHLLEQQAEILEDMSLRWPMNDYLMVDRKVDYSYGLSHGMPSILAVLIKYFEKGILPKKSKEMAEGTLNNLLSVQFTEENKTCYFPSFVNPHGEKETSRLSWCYGDLSVSLILFKYSKVFNSKPINDFAMQVALKTTTRTIEDSFIMDAGICHGAIGNAFLFSKLYNITNNDFFNTTAQNWLKIGLDMATHTDGFAGFKSYQNGNYHNEKGLLEGVSGIGLCLLHFLNPSQKTHWEKFFLLD